MSVRGARLEPGSADATAFSFYHGKWRWFYPATHEQRDLEKVTSHLWTSCFLFCERQGGRPLDSRAAVTFCDSGKHKEIAIRTVFKVTAQPVCPGQSSFTVGTGLEVELRGYPLHTGNAKWKEAFYFLMYCPRASWKITQEEERTSQKLLISRHLLLLRAWQLCLLSVVFCFVLFPITISPSILLCSFWIAHGDEHPNLDNNYKENMIFFKNVYIYFQSKWHPRLFSFPLHLYANDATVFVVLYTLPAQIISLGFTFIVSLN